MSFGTDGSGGEDRRRSSWLKIGSQGGGSEVMLLVHLNLISHMIVLLILVALDSNSKSKNTDSGVVNNRDKE